MRDSSLPIRHRSPVSHQTPVLGVVVPFHNEAADLPAAIASLRGQRLANVPVIFVDNGSRDGSATLVRQCPEVASGRWSLIAEERVGKYRAMAAGVACCRERFGASHVAFLDADSTCAPDWLESAMSALIASDGTAGYVYSPYSYLGFDRLPVFDLAYRAVERVTGFIIEQVGWFGNCAGATFAADVLDAFLARAGAVSEQGLRCSLLALATRRAGILSRSRFFTSARRIVATEQNFTQWCFYDRGFYLRKDINAPSKAAMNANLRELDLTPSAIPLFFRRQAVKIACRNLVPLVMFDRDRRIAGRLAAALGARVLDDMLARVDGIRWHASLITSHQFETLLHTIGMTCAESALVETVERMIAAAADRTRPPRPGGLRQMPRGRADLGMSAAAARPEGRRGDRASVPPPGIV
jgi:glycosyltransferase involved in cell wall biosynthesis